MTASRTCTRRGGRGDAVSTRDREQTFVEHYLATLNGRKAALAAGYTEASAAQEAHRLLRKPNVRQQIDERRREAMETLGKNREHLLAELACIAFFDVRRLMHADGRWKLPHELDDATAAAIKTVRFVDRKDEHGKTVVEPIYVPYEKNLAADRLARHLGLFALDNQQQGQSAVEQLRAFIRSIGHAGRIQAKEEIPGASRESLPAPVASIPVRE